MNEPYMIEDIPEQPDDEIATPEGWRNERDFADLPEKFNKPIRDRMVPVEAKFMAANYRTVVRELEAGWATVELPQVKNEPCLLVGSGPSLDGIAPFLKDWKPAIFCSTSQAVTLCHYGRPPDFIVAYDIKTSSDELSKTDTWQGKKSMLLLHPGVSPGFLEYWHGAKGYYLAILPKCPVRQVVSQMMYDFIRVRCIMSGSTNGILIVLARVLGYNPIFVTGFDYGYPWNRQRFRQSYYDHEKEAWFEVPVSKPAKKGKDVYLSANGVWTDEMQVFYKGQTIKMCRMDQLGREMPQVINATPGGIWTEIPAVEIPHKRFVETQGRGWEKLYRTQAEMIDAYDRYLVAHNCFPIRFPRKEVPGGMGVVPLDSSNYLREVPCFIEYQINPQLPPDQRIDPQEVLVYLNRIRREQGYEDPDVTVDPAASAWGQILADLEERTQSVAQKQEGIRTALAAFAKSQEATNATG